MKRIGKLFAALLCVLMLVTSMAGSAFAAAEQNLDVVAGTTNGSITVNKYVVVDKYALIPNEEFTFTLTPVADTTGMTDEGQAIKSGVAVTKNDVEIAFTNDSTLVEGSTASNDSGITTDGANQKYATATGTISFAGASFTAPGIYRYALKESTPATGTAGMTYDKSEFYVDVIVGYADEVEENAGTMSILGVKTFRYIKKDSNAVDGIGEKETNKFVNDFATEKLEISKTVTGNMGDHNKEFSFTVNVAANTQLSAGKTITAVKTDAAEATSSVTVTVGTAYEFVLKHTEKLELKGLPVGSSYTVTETDYSGDSYTTSLITTENGTDAESATARTITNTVVAGGNTEAFTNDKTLETPTGILLDIAPYALIAVIAAAAAILMISKKRRRSAH